MVGAHVVPKKGKEAFAIKVLAKDISLLGYPKVILKSDGEPAIVALKDAVKLEVGIEVIKEESPAGDHQANGHVEAAVRHVQGQFRTMRSALEGRLGSKAKEGWDVIPWLVSHAAATINRRRVGEDGMTAFRRWEGKDFRTNVAEFGESV